MADGVGGAQSAEGSSSASAGAEGGAGGADGVRPRRGRRAARRAPRRASRGRSPSPAQAPSPPEVPADVVPSLRASDIALARSVLHNAAAPLPESRPPRVSKETSKRTQWKQTQIEPTPPGAPTIVLAISSPISAMTTPFQRARESEQVEAEILLSPSLLPPLPPPPLQKQMAFPSQLVPERHFAQHSGPPKARRASYESDEGVARQDSSLSLRSGQLPRRGEEAKTVQPSAPTAAATSPEPHKHRPFPTLNVLSDSDSYVNLKPTSSLDNIASVVHGTIRRISYNSKENSRIAENGERLKEAVAQPPKSKEKNKFKKLIRLKPEASKPEVSHQRWPRGARRVSWDASVPSTDSERVLEVNPVRGQRASGSMKDRRFTGPRSHSTAARGMRRLGFETGPRSDDSSKSSSDERSTRRKKRHFPGMPLQPSVSAMELYRPPWRSARERRSLAQLSDDDDNSDDTLERVRSGSSIFSYRTPSPSTPASPVGSVRTSSDTSIDDVRVRSKSPDKPRRSALKYRSKYAKINSDDNYEMLSPLPPSSAPTHRPVLPPIQTSVPLRTSPIPVAPVSIGALNSVLQNTAAQRSPVNPVRTANDPQFILTPSQYIVPTAHHMSVDMRRIALVLPLSDRTSAPGSSTSGTAAAAVAVAAASALAMRGLARGAVGRLAGPRPGPTRVPFPLIPPRRCSLASGSGTRVELHAHLEGSIRHETIWELMKIKKMELPGDGSLDAMREALLAKSPVGSANHREPSPIYIQAVAGDLDALERIAFEFCEDKVKEGVLYVEARYVPHLLAGHDINGDTKLKKLTNIVMAVNKGFQMAENHMDITVRTILCVTIGMDNAQEVIHLCQLFRNNGVVGIDLMQPRQGLDTKISNRFVIDEEVPLSEEELRAFDIASAVGISRTVHAGEFGSPFMVDRAIDKYRAQRLGHGYQVVADPTVYAKCRERNVHFECCPWDSLLSSAVHPGREKHPVAQFAEDGVNFSLNNGRPTHTGLTLQEVYDLTSTWGLTETHLVRSNINALRSSFLTATEKDILMKRLLENIGIRKRSNKR